MNPILLDFGIVQIYWYSVIILFAMLGTNIQIIKLVSGIVFIFRPLIQNYYVKKKYNINLKNANSEFKLKQKWDGLAQHIAAVIHSNTDITVLTFFVSLKEVSVYSVYYLVVKGVVSIIQSFSNGIDASFGDMIAKNEYDNLNKKFNMYEVLYFTVITIIFTCTIVLITPFISVYTRGITDANYIRYLFGYLLVISEYIWAIRLPYSSITLAAGHFKETRKGAWLEAIVNIALSIALVWKYGIIGVAIGTIVAMFIRTLEFIYHTNKYILKRNIFNTLKKFFLIILETILIFMICRYLPYVKNSSYINWLVNALITGLVATVVVIVINTIVYKNNMKQFLNIIRFNLKRSK